MLNKEGRPARIAAGIGAAWGKRNEPLLCEIPGSVPLLEGRGVRGGLTGGPTDMRQVHGAERDRGAAERSCASKWALRRGRRALWQNHMN